MIRVNDLWEIPWQPGMTVEDVLSACDFTHHYLAVSVNGRLLNPEAMPEQLVSDGDDVHVIHIIGGG